MVELFILLYMLYGLFLWGMSVSLVGSFKQLLWGVSALPAFLTAWPFLGEYDEE